MQTLILDRLTDRLTAAGATFTVDFKYANTGTVRVLDPDTLAAAAQLDFDFQDRRCSFDVDYRTTIACHWYGQARTETQIPAVKSSPGEVVDTVVAYLTQPGAAA